MIITVELALKLLPVVANMIAKISKAITTKEPATIEEELKMLEELRLRSAEDVIAEADRDSNG